MFKAGNSRATIAALVALVDCLYVHPNVVGVELLAAPDFDQQFKLQRWYERAVEAIRDSLPTSVSEDFPIYVPDSWDPERFARWVGTRQDFVVLDHHVSRVFRTFNHRFKPYWYPMEHEDIIRRTFAEKLEELQSATQGKAIVGEWYSAQSTTGEVTEKEITVTVGSQLAMFRKHCPGNFFSQYKAGLTRHKATALVLDQMGLFPAWVGGRNPNQPVNDLPWHFFGRYKEKAISEWRS
jgi:glucan 1,3-beta-glucosidase